MVYVYVPIFWSVFAHCGTGFWYGDRGDFISDEGNRLKLCKCLAVNHKMHRIPTKLIYLYKIGILMAVTGAKWDKKKVRQAYPHTNIFQKNPSGISQGELLFNYF